jgi:nucleoside-diphosphate-sugar epimerase
MYVVTGAAGFIGSHVSGLLLEQGHSVVGIDNLNDGYDVRLKRWRLEQLQRRSRFAFHQVDLTESDATNRVFSAIDGTPEAVLHLGARAGVRQSIKDPWSYYQANVQGTLTVLDICREREIPKLVMASTSSLYGADPPRPFSEAAATDHPLSPYAASKKAAETLCYSYHSLYGMDITILRYFTVYGPAGRPDMSIFRFIRWIREGDPLEIYGDGTQERDFTYVTDVARGTLAAIALPGYEIVNLGSDRPWSLLRVIEELEPLVGRKARLELRPAQDADVPATWADISKARELLGWQPGVELPDGLKATVDWYLENRGWAKDIALG